MRDKGDKFEIPLTKKICDLLLVDDTLVMAIGKRQKQWRIMHLVGIASSVGGQTMASFAVPRAENPKYLN